MNPLTTDNEQAFLYTLEPDAPQPFWTRRRIFLTIMAIIIVITLLAYTLSGLFIPPPLPPTLEPGSMI